MNASIWQTFVFRGFCITIVPVAVRDFCVIGFLTNDLKRSPINVLFSHTCTLFTDIRLILPFQYLSFLLTFCTSFFNLIIHTFSSFTFRSHLHSPTAAMSISLFENNSCQSCSLNFSTVYDLIAHFELEHLREFIFS